VKLPFSTGKQIPNSTNSVKSTSNGIKGILKAIKTLARDEHVGGGYYPYVIIQPRILDNREAKIACFNGKAIMKVMLFQERFLIQFKDACNSGRCIMGTRMAQILKNYLNMLRRLYEL